MSKQANGRKCRHLIDEAIQCDETGSVISAGATGERMVNSAERRIPMKIVTILHRVGRGNPPQGATWLNRTITRVTRNQGNPSLDTALSFCCKSPPLEVTQEKKQIGKLNAAPQSTSRDLRAMLSTRMPLPLYTSLAHLMQIIQSYQKITHVIFVINLNTRRDGYDLVR